MRLVVVDRSAGGILGGYPSILGWSGGVVEPAPEQLRSGSLLGEPAIGAIELREPKAQDVRRVCAKPVFAPGVTEIPQCVGDPKPSRRAKPHLLLAVDRFVGDRLAAVAIHDLGKRFLMDVHDGSFGNVRHEVAARERLGRPVEILQTGQFLVIWLVGPDAHPDCCIGVVAKRVALALDGTGRKPAREDLTLGEPSVRWRLLPAVGDGDLRRGKRAHQSLDPSVVDGVYVRAG